MEGKVLMTAGYSGAGKTQLSFRIRDEKGYEYVGLDEIKKITKEQLDELDLPAKISVIKNMCEQALAFLQETKHLADNLDEEMRDRQTNAIIYLYSERRAIEATVVAVKKGTNVVYDNPGAFIRGFRNFIRTAMQERGVTEVSLIIVRATREKLLAVIHKRHGDEFGRLRQKVESAIAEGRDPVIPEERWGQLYFYDERISSEMMPIDNTIEIGFLAE